MKKISGKNIAKILMKNGWNYYQMKGSHMVLQKNDKYVHVPINMKVAKWKLLKRIERKTGVTF